MATLQSSPAILLEEQESVKHVIVHPLVLLHILDHHTRRQDTAGRVIGTLLGRKLDAHTVEVTNCFAVPHVERDDELAIGKDFNKNMLSLYMRSNRKEVVVGWYASTAQSQTAPLIADTSSLIHDFYSGETDEGDPIHLVVDTRLTQDAVAIRAYKSALAIVQGEAVGSLFHELQLSLRTNEPEAICLTEMIKQKQETAVSSEGLQLSLQKLHELLDRALHYVTAVVEGKEKPDAERGLRIADALEAVPRIRPAVMDKMFHDSLQDLLMVTYLSNITKTQITIAEKLNASLGMQ